MYLITHPNEFCFLLLFSSIADITAGAVGELCAGRVPSITTLSRDTESIPSVCAILALSTSTPPIGNSTKIKTSTFQVSNLLSTLLRIAACSEDQRPARVAS